MKIADLRINDIDFIIELFNVDKDIAVFDSNTLPKKYFGNFIYRIIGSITSFQVEKHNGSTTNSYLHNLNGPALIEIINTGDFVLHYYIENKIHNNYGPAIIYYTKGIKTKEEYFINGKRHNSVGPAIITYGYDNKYYVNNKSINETLFFERLNQRNNDK